MPFLELYFNDRFLSRAGREVPRLVTFHISCAANKQATLQLHEMFHRAAETDHLWWLPKELTNGDAVSVNFVSEPASTHEPSLLPSHVPEPFAMTAKETGPATGARNSYDATTAESGRFKHRLRITTQQETVDATLENQETLQAVINMTSQSCKIEVISVTVHPDGTSTGKEWLLRSLQLGELVKFEYAA